jgi:hypothetical protein
LTIRLKILNILHFFLIEKAFKIVMEPTAQSENTVASSWLSTAVAILVGLLGSCIIWIITPYNNQIIGNTHISDSYLPVAALFILLIILWCVNPLLRLCRFPWPLRGPQLALITGIMLMASMLPGQGLLRMLPYALAKAPVNIQTNAVLDRVYKQMDLPPGLFPDKMGFGEKTPVVNYFLTQLPPGGSIPWQAWVPPLLAWGILLVFIWLMMSGLGLIVFPQWRYNERLAFPLVTLQQSFIEEPGEGRLFASLFRQRAFWIAVIGVFILQLMYGANRYAPEVFPAIPLEWNLSGMFTEEPLNYLPYWIPTQRLYFIFIGVAFFMPMRIGFSIWFFVIVYALYSAFKQAYFPPYYAGTVNDHRFGAMLALTVGVLWLGRAHWREVARSLVKHADSAVDRYNRHSAIIFLGGCAGIYAWLLWVGVGLGYALALVTFGVMVTLLITRIVAETGMAYMRIDSSLYNFLTPKLMVVVGPAGIFFTAVFNMLFSMASRTNHTTFFTHAVALDEKKGFRHHIRLAYISIAVLVIGLMVCGAAHLFYTYHHSTTLDGKEQPVSEWGTRQLDDANTRLEQLDSKNFIASPYKKWPQITFGAGLAGLLQWACITIPQWPIHPIGLLMVNTYFANIAWFSIFLGWLIHLLIIHYGGARLYRDARPLFMGLIVGEILAAVCWCIIPFIIYRMGSPYIVVPILPQ